MHLTPREKTISVIGDVFFFFQAEDGIRDGHVTGVQTCALPISSRRARTVLWAMEHATLMMATAQLRSEERRVGKECISRWAADPKKKETKRTERAVRIADISDESNEAHKAGSGTDTLSQ